MRRKAETKNDGIEAKTVKKISRVLTIPNILSLVRIALIPLIVWLYLNCKRYDLALLLIVISGLTDTVDGWIARRFNMVTDVGKVLDPLADKLTQAVVILCLASISVGMRWLFGILVVKEMVMGIAGLVVLKKTGKVNSAKWYGKLCTWLLYVTMLIHLIFPNMPLWISNLSITICAISIFHSLICYLLRYVSILMEANGNKPLPRLKLDWRIIVACAILLSALTLIFCLDISVEDILGYTPENIPLAIAIVIFLYVLKSISFIFTLRSLQFAVGIMFPLPLAIVVNIAGSAIATIVPYLLGKFGGRRTVEKLKERYPKLSSLEKIRDENAFVTSMVVRCIGITPIDPTSVYFGAIGMDFIPYFVGGLIGLLPVLIVRTALGVSIENTGSPAFITCMVVYVISIVLSIAVAWTTLKKYRENEDKSANNS